MWQVLAVCSSCAEEAELVVESLDDAEREVCECGYCLVVVSVARFEPVYAERAEVIRLRVAGDLAAAA